MTAGIPGTYCGVTRTQRSTEESSSIRSFSLVEPWISLLLSVRNETYVYNRVPFARPVALSVPARHGPDATTSLFADAVVRLVADDAPVADAAELSRAFCGRVRTLALSEPAWLARFLPWLRMSAVAGDCVVPLALEAAQVMLRTGHAPLVRGMVGAVLQRADEPGLAVSYWRASFSAKLPEQVREGIADAVVRLYDERGYLSHGAEGLPFSTVLAATNPTPRTEAQADLFAYLKSGAEGPIPSSLAVMKANAWLRAIPAEERSDLLADWEHSAAPILTGAGMTAKSVETWLSAPMDAVAWQAVIPLMDYAELVSHLDDFDAAGVPGVPVATRLADPLEIALADRPRSALLRLENPSERWHWALLEALRLCLTHAPEPEPITLIEAAQRGQWPF
jgi:hypothetical protein